MPNKVVLADSISSLPEYQGWYNAIMEVLNDVDLGKLLVYLVDNVDPVALPYLADQFDVLGYKGMRMATNQLAQRDVIKRAIELHRYKGTEWAISEALATIGFTNVIIKKGIAGGYNHWAKFGIDVTNSGVAVTGSALADILAMVNEYKRAVCVLEDVTMGITVTDTLNVDDPIATCSQAIVANDTLTLSTLLHYDGEAEFNGDYEYSGDSDVATIT